jgi:hypothetical protein
LLSVLAVFTFNGFNLFLFLRVAEVLDGSVFALLALKSDEGGSRSDVLSLLLLAELVNLLVKGGHLFEFALGNVATALGQHLDQLLVTEAESDVGYTDLDVLENLGASVELAREVAPGRPRK